MALPTCQVACPVHTRIRRSLYIRVHLEANVTPMHCDAQSYDVLFVNIMVQ